MRPTEPRALDALVRWAVQAPHPPEVGRKARLLVLDTLGCALAGLAAPPVARLARTLADAEGGALRIPASEVSLSPGGAAALLATAACWDEACEGLARAHGRPGVAVIAACLALGVQRDVTLGRLVDAVVAGYEVGARMGESLRIRPGMHVDAGWPSLGVAAAAARLIGASAAGALAAVELAAAQLPFSLYLPITQGADGRNTYLGHAAWLGLYAASAAAAGIAAPEGAAQAYAALALGSEGGAPSAPAGEYLILESYLKPYAAVRHVHYGAQAALELRAEVRLGRATRVVLTVYPEAQTYCANRAPRTPIQAQFSLSFGVAAALRFGALGPEVYRAPMFEDAELRRIERLVEIRTDESLAAGGGRGARLEVEADGERHACTVTQVPGDPNLPFTATQCRDKFLRNSAPALGAAEARACADAILDAQDSTALRSVWSRLVAPGAAQPHRPQETAA